MFIARNKLKEFAEDIGIDKPKLGQFSNAVMAELEKTTSYKYSAKTERLALSFMTYLTHKVFNVKDLLKVYGEYT